jgi:hypothetical protein
MHKVKTDFSAAYLFFILANILAKASELLTTAENKAAAAADVIATKAVEAKNTTVAAAQNAASTVQGKNHFLHFQNKEIFFIS